jgi:hypothetical protein
MIDPARGKRPLEPNGLGKRTAAATSERPRKIRRFLAGVRDERIPELPPLFDDPRPGKIGICLSGGGIRSASFNLGVLQVMKERGVLDRADYLSAVSGGAYIAAAHAIVYGQTTDKASFEATPPYAQGSPEETWLRNHSDYLAPGAYGKIRALVRLLAGIATNLALIGIFFYVIGRPIGWVYDRWIFSHIPWKTANPFDTIPHWAFLSVGCPAAAGALLSWIDLLFHPRESRHRLLSLWSARLFYIAALPLIFLVLLPYLVLLMRHKDVITHILRLSNRTSVKPAGPLPPFLLPAVGSLILAGMRALWARKRSLVANLVAAIVGPLALIVTLVWFVAGSHSGSPSAGEFSWWLALLALFEIIYFFSDLTNWSLHPFYKRRLWDGFAVERVQVDGSLVAQPVDYWPLVPLSQAQKQAKPELILCGAANVSTPGLTPPGREAISFTFSARETGMPDGGMVSTSTLEAALGARARDLTLMSAVAISGAAISPSMGKMTMKPMRFLLGLLNVRLGVWLPNPLRHAEWGQGLRAWDRPRLHYFVKELFGLNGIDDKFLYVTDGGHFENLGLVELLRRGCTDIYCFDASGDLDDTFNTLGEAIAIARSDLKVDVDIDPTVICPRKNDACDADELPPTEHAIGTIYYEEVEPGTLVYTRAAVTPEAPWDVRAFRQKDPRFPHHKTLDQLFNEVKFRAYWELGRRAAENAYQSMIDTKRSIYGSNFDGSNL